MKIEGKIVHGKHLGRTIDFPTANLLPDRPWKSEKNGVYAAWFYTDGRKLGCMVNIGHHPTVPDGPATIEAHIFDFEGDLYGKSAEIETVAFLRGEVKFESVDALKAQLERDKVKSLHILSTAAIE